MERDIGRFIQKEKSKKQIKTKKFKDQLEIKIKKIRKRKIKKKTKKQKFPKALILSHLKSLYLNL